MAQVTGIAESYDINSFFGRLFREGAAPRSLLGLIGASAELDTRQVPAARLISSNQFVTAVTATEPTETVPSHLEGADTTFESTDQQVETNVVQIFKEGWALSYSALSDAQSLDEYSTSGEANFGQGELQNAKSVQIQRDNAIRRIWQQANKAFINGTYALGSAGVARTTRGLASALTTNVVDGSAAALSTTMVETAQKDIIAAGMMDLGQPLVALCPATVYEKLVALYLPTAIEDGAPRDRMQAGMMLRRIWTTWGPIDVAYEVDMPALEIHLVQPSYLGVVARNVNNGGGAQGALVVEELAKTGDHVKFQAFCELGLDYGAESCHARIHSFT
jgi:hypothetical protein